MARETWNVDTTHSEVNFIVRHMVVTKVRGQFRKWSASVELEDGDLTKGQIKAEFEANSIDTREEKRDAHLRSQDFFGAEQHPKLRFTSTRIERSGKTYRVTGDLEIHGVSKSITLEVQDQGKAKDPWGNEKLLFEGETKINRKDWGLHWNQALEMGGVLVSDEVQIEVSVQLVKAQG